MVKPKNKKTLSTHGRRGFLTSPIQSVQVISKSTKKTLSTHGRRGFLTSPMQSVRLILMPTIHFQALCG